MAIFRGRISGAHAMCHLQGFHALAVVGVAGAGWVLGIVFAREGMAREEADTGGKDGSGETS